MTSCRSSGSPAARVVSALMARSRTVVPVPEYHRWAGSQVASVSANVMTPGLPRNSLVIPVTADPACYPGSVAVKQHPRSLARPSRRGIPGRAHRRSARLGGPLGGRRELEPVEAVARQRKQGGELAERGGET